MAYAQNLQLSQITVAAQVRTRNGFDREGIAELAESLKTMGMLQPMLVRPINDDSPVPKFQLVAGHRRHAAAKVAGWTEAPVMVLDSADADEAAAAQMVENIQREQLTVADVADGVRQLLDKHKKPAIVCKMLQKSAAWVSKHAALTRPAFNQDVRQLMEAGACGDLETLLALDQISKNKHPDAGAVFVKLTSRAMSQGLTRAEARKALEDLKTPKPATPEPTPPADTSDADCDDESETMGNAAAALRRTFTLPLDVSTMLWLRHEVREALPKSVRRSALLEKLDAFASECGLTTEQADIED